MTKGKSFRRNLTQLPEAVKASFWFTICNVIHKGIAMITTPVFTRIMSTEQYGQFTVYQSWYTIIAIFATLNLSAGAYNNGMVKWPNERDKFTSSVQSLSTVTTIAFFIVYIVAIPFWNRILKMSSVFIFAMFAELLFVPAFNFWAAGQRFDYKYKLLVIVTLIIAIASPLIGVIAVLATDCKAEARVLSFVSVQVSIGLVFYILNYCRGKTIYNKTYWRFALAFNLPLIPHYLSQSILAQADRIMIDNMIGSSEAALYGVAYSVSMMFNIVTNAINNTFVPYTYKALSNRNYQSLRKNATLLISLVAAACILITAFAPEVIRIIAAPNYYEAYKVIPPISISLVFTFATSIYGNIEFFFEKTKFIMIASSLAAIANVVLNYMAIPIYGYLAAAYTTLVCYVLLAIAHYTACSYILKKKNMELSENIPRTIYNDKLILLISILAIASMILMTLIYEHVIIRYLIMLIVLSLFFLNRKRVIDQLKEIKHK